MADNGLLYLDLSMQGFDDLADDFKARALPVLQKYAADLASQTHAKVQELATKGLHMRRDRYLAALSFKEVNDSTWVISLDSSAVWIDDGLPENHQMLDKLLASPKAKVAKDGSRYVVVPFNHGPGAVHLGSESGKTNDDLKRVVQDELKRRKIPFAKLERHIHNGEVKLGKLHDIEVGRNHPTKTHEGIGQGEGRIGDARQGFGGDRFLDRIRIYQRAVRGKNGKPKVVRGIMTFRTASSKQDKNSYWVHPGSAPKRFFEQAYDWALNEWEKVLVPRVLEELTGE